MRERTAKQWCEHAAASAGSLCESWTRAAAGSRRLPDCIAVLRIPGVGQLSGRGSGDTEAEAEENACRGLRYELRRLAAGVTVADDAEGGE